MALTDGSFELDSKSKLELEKSLAMSKNVKNPLMKLAKIMYEGARASKLIPIDSGNLEREVTIAPISNTKVEIKHWMYYAEYRYEENRTGVVHWYDVYYEQHSDMLDNLVLDEMAKEMGFK